MSGPVTRADTPVEDPEEEPPAPPCVEHTPSREVRLGDMPVRRALPRRHRRTVGAWCFVDHFGPADGPARMQVGPHPHTGLATLTWFLEGEALHLDSLGSEQRIRPGQVNLMTAGHGIAHAEETPGDAPARQHGLQLWIAQPEATRHGPPAFEHHAELPALERDGWRITVLVGEAEGARSSVRADTPLVGLALSADAGTAELPLDPSFEHALVVLDGAVRLGAAPGDRAEPGELVYLGLGRDELRLDAEAGTNAVLLGGEPFPEEVRMSWNFVARTTEELDAARDEWNAGSDRFGAVRSRLDRILAPGR